MGVIEIRSPSCSTWSAAQGWRLHEVSRSIVSAKQIESSSFDELYWQSELNPDNLGILTRNVEELNLLDLYRYRSYLRANGLDARRYDLSFWRKLFQPATTIVMMLVALSFIFGPLRSVSMGTRLVSGVITGFAFHLGNNIFGPLSIVYGLSPIIGASLPMLALLLAAVILLGRIR